MSATRHTALGIEQNGRRVLTVAGHVLGACIYMPIGVTVVPLTPDDADHIVRLLTEFSTKERLKASTKEPV